MTSDGPHTIRVSGLSTTDFVVGFSRKPASGVEDTEHRPVGGMGHVTRKPVFWVFDQVRPKLACSAIETSCRLDILPIETTNIILFKQQITKALIRLHGCTSCCVDAQADLHLCRFSLDVARFMVANWPVNWL